MIRSFGDSITDDIFHGVQSKKTRKIPQEIIDVAIRKLDQLNAAIEINDLKIPPGNRLEKLKADLKDYYSIRINDKFRIIFQWKNNDSYNVSITDYH